MRIWRFLIPILASIIIISPAFSLETPKALPKDKRLRVINYNPNDVVKLISRLRTTTVIEFAPTEEIVQVSMGDTFSWEDQKNKNVLFLKPRVQLPPTNIIVMTLRQNGARRLYKFEARSLEGPVTKDDSFFLIRFRYPRDEAEKRRLEARLRKKTMDQEFADQTLSLHQSYAARNYSYSAQGSRILQPDTIYDDGKTTTMYFAGNRQIPAIYTVQNDGDEILVPWDVRQSGEVVIIHATAKEFRLRRGDDVLCVFNEAHDPVGVNPGTGTTSPSVERVIKSEPRGAKR